MQPRSPIPSQGPEPKIVPSTRPTFRPLLSKIPGFSPLASLLPFSSSLKPLPLLPEIIDATKAAPSSEVAARSPGAVGTDRGRSPHRRTFARAAAAVAAVAALAAVAVGAGQVHWTKAPPTTMGRRVGAPTLKPIDGGGYVRWQTDAVDVVVDKSFSDLAGDGVFGAALDAWRGTGAGLPSVSTIPGEGRSVGYDPNGTNENVVMFAPAGWAKAKGALAVTVLTYDNASGQIVDADILVNGGGRYFKQFDRDESNDGDEMVSIESGGGSGTSGTSRFDLQSVVTHEIGHFFGLGEDFDDTKTTMFVKTRPGEIHKRALTSLDSDVITTLYAAAPASSQSGGGCGRSQLAPTAPNQTAWVGFGAALLGLGLLSAARRSRLDARVRVVATRRANVRRAARFGGWLTAFGLGLFLLPPNLEAAAGEPVARGDADVEIVATAPRWDGGVLETELTYRVTTCHVASCPEGDQKTVVSGGTRGRVTQVVGPYAVPEQGARLHVALRDQRDFYKMLNPTFKP